MSSETVDVVRQTYAEWAHGNMRAGGELFDPEIVFESFMPDADNRRVVAHGTAQIDRFMREFLRQWRDYRLVGDEFVDQGDKVLVIGHQAALGRESGVAVESPMCSAWTFREGSVIHLVFDPDPQQAVEATLPD